MIIAGNISSLEESLSTSEGHDELLRSFAPIAPASSVEESPESLGEALGETKDALVTIAEGVASEVNGTVGVVQNGSRFEVGTLVGGAVVGIVAAALTKGKSGGKGLFTNPFKGKTPKQVDMMLRDKGFDQNT